VTTLNLTATRVHIDVLDHGYVELVGSWGSDAQIIEAARMSTGKGFRGWGPFKCVACEGTGVRIGEGEGGMQRVTCDRCKGAGQVPGDEKLLAYLYTHKHTTPFEMAGLTIEVQAPIFVFREWHRHRTQSYNEMSARYTPLPDINYLPTEDRCVLAGGTNKQAQAFSMTELSLSDAGTWLRELNSLYRHAQVVYEKGLQLGIPKEIARLPVPVARYSRMRASANLLNWLRFLTLRTAPQAQWEIRQYADTVAEMVEGLFPRTFALWAKEQVARQS